MDDFEGKLNQILSDPASMAQIMSIAQNLMGQTNSAPASSSDDENQQTEAPNASATPAANFEQGIPASFLAILQQAGSLDGKEVALFNALKPFLKPDRREKIDKAMRIARLSHLAGFAIRNLDLW